MKKINLDDLPIKGKEPEVKNKPAQEIEKKKCCSFGKIKIGKKTKILFSFLAVIFIILAAFGGFLYISGRDLLAEKEPLLASFNQVKEAVKQQDLAKVKEGVLATKNSLAKVENKVEKIGWMKKLPFLGSYFSDLDHGFKAGSAGLEAVDLAVEALIPYADILGFSGAASATQSGKTTMDRITFIMTTLDKISPQFDQISEKLLTVKSEVDQIDEVRYPEDFQGKKVREIIKAAKLAVDQGANLMNDAKPLLEQLPKLLGMEKDQFYLIIFQNDAELRPTGGFMTAYGILKVSKGKISPLLSQDIYSLDARLSRTEAAPEALVKYLKLPYGDEARSGRTPQWRIRDMNLSPDFALAMEKFYTYYVRAAGNQTLTGILAIDTKVLTALLKIIGTVGVPEWGNFSAENDKRCDCPQVVYRLEELADKPISGVNLSRKAVITPLMHSILLNAFQSPKAKLPLLMEATLKSVYEKHFLVYLFDKEAQKAIEAFNLAGRIKEYSGDYLHLNDTSFTGAKSNLFIKQAVEQKIEFDNDGGLIKTVSVNYKNSFPASNCNLEKGGLCLNAPYRDWVRLYVPKGSTLISSNGFETEIKTYEELGKTVFEGFFGDKYPLRPQSSAKIVFKYKLPAEFNRNNSYSLMIQKQPGIEAYDYVVDYNGQKQEFELRTDKEIKF
ncbi:MAG: hypothetical protein BWY24_00506 [Microgenomates group bacterium ADurb.Bin219]|nr:MAG: hypothetical protein BWY24_00506 [Microgenomates group bacterium ADurb.Bin219]HNP89527.1 DUF4012 domain-containing protein [Candidatus Woesebacteria bacterium]